MLHSHGWARLLWNSLPEEVQETTLEGVSGHRNLESAGSCPLVVAAADREPRCGCQIAKARGGAGRLDCAGDGDLEELKVED